MESFDVPTENVPLRVTSVDGVSFDVPQDMIEQSDYLKELCDLTKTGESSPTLGILHSSVIRRFVEYYSVPLDERGKVPSFLTEDRTKVTLTDAQKKLVEWQSGDEAPLSCPHRVFQNRLALAHACDYLGLVSKPDEEQTKVKEAGGLVCLAVASITKKLKEDEVRSYLGQFTRPNPPYTLE